ncbi:TIGR02452 family protein [Ruminococcaceae bacterium YRB3002]|nr:TIGR02452 family protein [Ruminococcaceae bacterium YRB3002]
MNNIQIAQETMRISKEKKYLANGREVDFSDADVEKVIVITPEAGAELVAETEQELKGEMCRISVINADSYEASVGMEKPLVMNFANAHKAGGGFLHGANAQEESLCRTSTLYASINSAAAAEMYRYNNTHINAVESDYMLISPEVVVIRGEGMRLLERPYRVGVVTTPAPNRRGAAMLTGKAAINETVMRRVRILCAAAAHYGFRSLVLGAWGCGAFGNDPKDISECFRKVIMDEGFGRLFEEIRFAVYGREDGRNITVFRETFAGR